MFCHVMAAFLGMAATLRLLVVTVPNLIFSFMIIFFIILMMMIIIIIMIKSCKSLTVFSLIITLTIMSTIAYPTLTSWQDLT